jgi:hypothetical protein
MGLRLEGSIGRQRRHFRESRNPVDFPILSAAFATTTVKTPAGVARTAERAGGALQNPFSGCHPPR